MDWEEQARQSTQEVLVIFDQMVMPRLRRSVGGGEGVFPVDGVLLRVEVKSTLTRGELRDAVRAAGEIYKLRFGNENKYVGWGAATALFAYENRRISFARSRMDDFERLHRGPVKEEGLLLFRLHAGDTRPDLGAMRGRARVLDVRRDAFSMAARKDARPA